MRVKFYLTGSGRSPVEEFLHGCSADLKSDFFDAVNLLNDGHVLQTQELPKKELELVLKRAREV
jgi:hypothetical protein